MKLILVNKKLSISEYIIQDNIILKYLTLIEIRVCQIKMVDVINFQKKIAIFERIYKTLQICIKKPFNSGMLVQDL